VKEVEQKRLLNGSAGVVCLSQIESKTVKQHFSRAQDLGSPRSESGIEREKRPLEEKPRYHDSTIYIQYNVVCLSNSLPVQYVLPWRGGGQCAASCCVYRESGDRGKGGRAEN
jgi:hypothetical protein